MPIQRCFVYVPYVKLYGTICLLPNAWIINEFKHFNFTIVVKPFHNLLPVLLLLGGAQRYRKKQKIYYNSFRACAADKEYIGST